MGVINKSYVAAKIRDQAFSGLLYYVTGRKLSQFKTIEDQ
jgi:hypothetical protein